MPPALNHLRLTKLPGSVREIELTRELGGLRIDITLARAGRFTLLDGGLGGCASVRLENGLALECLSGGIWSLPPDARQRRTWVIIAACR